MNSRTLKIKIHLKLFAQSNKTFKYKSKKNAELVCKNSIILKIKIKEYFKPTSCL